MIGLSSDRVKMENLKDLIVHLTLLLCTLTKQGWIQR